MKIIIILCLFIGLELQAKDLNYNGIAINEKGAVVYIEKHKVMYKKGKIQSADTIYYAPDGKKILAKMNSSFLDSTRVPTHRFIDKRTGQEFGARWKEGKPVMFKKDNPKDEESTMTMEALSSYVGGQGLHYHMSANIRPYVERKETVVKFLIPGNLDNYEFKVNFIRESKKEIVFEMVINNWLLSLFAPKLVTKYDPTGKKLLYYSGPSNLKTDAGKLQNVVITYKYF